MYFLVIYLPFISFIVLSLFGRFFGFFGSSVIAVINMFITMVLSYCIFYEVVLKGSVCFYKLFTWLNIGLLNVFWGFYFDPVACVMLVVVSTISFFVHLYSIDYMRYDIFNTRFMSYLSLFTWFMIILITADNLLQLFVGWEGVGLVSFLLINFWFTIVESNKCALKAMLMNRIGDLGLALAMALLFYEFKSLDFCVIFSVVHYFSHDFFFFFFQYTHAISIISFFLFLGAIGKSAQFGLHTWLPLAMAAPTPVSALIHAATMVTAGVFLLIRMSPVIELSSSALFVIAFLGVFTSFVTALIGLFQHDLKKIIAYSTCSQLGYMVFICGLSNFSLSLFHLSNHAFFKALLFLSAGAIIHGMADEQDVRRYGGLIILLPFSYVMILVGSLALMGIPFLTGFYSKDIIIETAYSAYIINSFFIYWLSVFTAFLTSMYSLRLIYYTFLAKPNGFKKSYEFVSDAPVFMMISLFCLFIFSVFFGYFFRDLFIGFGTDVWLNSVSVSILANIVSLESEFLCVLIKLIPLFFTAIGVYSIIWFNSKFIFLIKFFSNKIMLFNKIYKFFSNKCYVDVIYNKIILKLFYTISYDYIRFVDRGIIELFGPLGFVRISTHILNFIKFFQIGLIYNYIFVFIIASICVIFSFFVFFEFEFWLLFVFITLFLYFDHRK